jgi:hypothetical protein
MALKENSQSRKPSGPLRESSRYTTSPTTTEGKANAVLSKVSTTARPLKCATPSHAPRSRPALQAIKEAHTLTVSDRATMLASIGSSEVMSEKAVTALLEKVFMPKVLRDFILVHQALGPHR